MRLKRVHLKDIGRFRGERTVDFDSIPDGLVCLVGANGAGKTTFLEATAPAPLFREFPTRTPGGFLDLANSRDSVVEVEFETGAGDQVRLVLRGDKGTAKGLGKQECYAHLNGVLVDETKGGKTAPFDAWVREHLVSRAMFYSNWFAVQKPGMLNGVGQFQTLGKADRSALFTEMLGIGHLQGMSKTASDGVGILAPLVQRLSEALVSTQAREEEAGRITDELDGLRMGLSDAARRLDEAKSVLADAIERRDALRVDSAAATTKAAAYAEKRDQLEARQIDLASVEHDLVEIGKALENEGELRAAAADVERLAKAVADMRADYQREKAIFDAMGERVKAAREKDDGARRRVTDLERYGEASDDARRRMEKEFADLAPIDAAESAITEADAYLETCVTAERVASEARTAARDLQRDLEAMLERLQAANEDSETLGKVPCEGEGDYAACQFLTRAGEARDSLPALRAEVDRLKTALEAAGDAKAAHIAAQATLDEAGSILRVKRTALESRRQIQRDVDELQRRIDLAAEKAPDLVTAEAEHEAANVALAAAVKAVPEQQEKLNEIIKAGQTQAADLKEARTRATGADELGGLHARQEEKEGRASQIRDEIASLETAVQDAPPEDLELRDSLGMAEVDAHDAQEQADAADGEARDYQTQIDRKEAVLGTYGDLGAKRVDIEARTQRLQVEIGVWATLAQALGRNGIQILEIDAAGPRVAEVANRLLEETLGARFRVEIITTKLRKSVKSGDDPYKDVFSIDVLDGENGIRQDLLNTSGGEEVFIADALREALTIVANDRRTDPVLTLWGDEPTGALSEDNARMYVERKRAAMRIGGIRQMLLVSHQREIWEHADWVLWFTADGEIQSIPTAEAIKRRVA